MKKRLLGYGRFIEEKMSLRCEVENFGMEKDVVESVTDCNTAGRPEAEQAWAEIHSHIDAAMVLRTLKWSNFGLLGNFYCGMPDMYTDLTLFQSMSGSNVILLEMSDLERYFRTVTEADVDKKLVQIRSFFRVLGDSPSDPITKKPMEEQIRWSAKVACAEERMIRESGIDGLAYYYRGLQHEPCQHRPRRALPHRHHERNANHARDAAIQWEARQRHLRGSERSPGRHHDLRRRADVGGQIPVHRLRRRGSSSGYHVDREYGNACRETGGESNDYILVDTHRYNADVKGE